MRSAEPPSGDVGTADDRTTKARIRDAAIACFAEFGMNDTTVRTIAAEAGVSPGLVIHHYGSMEGLRTACEEHVAGAIREVRENTMSTGPGIDVLRTLSDTDVGSVAGYLARVLAESSPTVDQLVDDLVADAVEYFDTGVRAGVLRHSDDPTGRAVVLVLWALGGLVLHDHFERLLGIDLTDPDIGSNPNLAAYMGPVYEILGTGIFTDALAADLQSVVSDSNEPPATGPKAEEGTE